MQTNTFPEHHLPPTPPSEPLGPIHNIAKMTTSTSSSHGLSTAPEQKHIWVITGPAGCGKTSVAEYLHSIFSLPYLEGDVYHPQANVEKMANGQPLTDADRWDWLILLREEAIKALEQSSGVIITCSALKRKYRDVMRIAAYHDSTVRVHFVFLNVSEAMLLDRVRARQNHYMKDSMVHSQIQSLETPTDDETDVLSVDASGSSKEVQALALAAVQNTMAEGST